MLDRIIRIIQFHSHNADLFSLTLSDHPLQPVRCDHRHIVIQAENIIAFCKCEPEIVQGRIIKARLPVNDPDAVPAVNLFVIIKNLLPGAVILHNNNLIITIG